MGRKVMLYGSLVIIEHVRHRGREKKETADVVPWPEPEVARVRQGRAKEISRGEKASKNIARHKNVTIFSP